MGYERAFAAVNGIPSTSRYARWRTSQLLGTEGQNHVATTLQESDSLGVVGFAPGTGHWSGRAHRSGIPPVRRLRISARRAEAAGFGVPRLGYLRHGHRSLR